MTQQIKLKAKLKAYSKAPFYLDYVRSVNVVNGVEEKLEPNTVYGLKDGQWHKIFLEDVEEINSRLSSLEIVTKSISEDILPTTQRDSALSVQYANNIKIEEDLDENSIIFTDLYGTPHRVRLQVQVDNESILYNNYNQLELVNKIDNNTIQEDRVGNMVVNSIHATQLIDGQSQDVYITGDEILSIINVLKDNNFISLDNLYTGDLKAINTMYEDTVATYTNGDNVTVQSDTNDDEIDVVLDLNEEIDNTNTIDSKLTQYYNEYKESNALLKAYIDDKDYRLNTSLLNESSIRQRSDADLYVEIDNLSKDIKERYAPMMEFYNKFLQATMEFPGRCLSVKKDDVSGDIVWSPIDQ